MIKPQRSFRGIFVLFGIAAILLLPNVSSAKCQQSETKTLSEVLRQAAADVIQHCRQNEIDSIGVLKFLVHDGQELADDAGTINTLLAKRMEIALVFANEPRQPITLIDNASAIANRIDGASHISTAGRTRLFSRQYPAMWGEANVKPELLISGVASLNKDLTRIEFSILGARDNPNELKQIGKDYVARTTPAVLTESGASFSTRGAFDNGQTKKFGESSDLPGDEKNRPESISSAANAVVQSANRVKTGVAAAHPLVDPKSPVRIEVFYDSEPIQFELKNGTALLREPQEGQKVEFRLTKDSTNARYGVVLKVNGQNTLRKQQLPDLSCGKWVFSKPAEQFAIRGFQMNQKELEQFRVLGNSESKSREVDFGDEVGLISMTVFAEGDAQPFDLGEDAQESQIVENARLPVKPSKSFGALKAKLLADANRGLITEGNVVQGQVRVVKFQPNPIPIMSATAKYYAKKSSK